MIAHTHVSALVDYQTRSGFVLCSQHLYIGMAYVFETVCSAFVCFIFNLFSTLRTKNTTQKSTNSFSLCRYRQIAQKTLTNYILTAAEIDLFLDTKICYLSWADVGGVTIVTSKVQSGGVIWVNFSHQKYQKILPQIKKKEMINFLFTITYKHSLNLKCNSNRTYILTLNAARPNIWDKALVVFGKIVYKNNHILN